MDLSRIPLCSYAAIRPWLATGTVILWRGDDLLGRTIRLFTEFSHASLAVRGLDPSDAERVFLVEALATGLELRILSERVRGYRGRVFACPPPGFGDVQANFASWPGNGTAIISKVGCGSAWSVTGMMRVAGVTGNAGSNGGPGGGGSGGGSPNNDYGIWPGANAYVWGGGPGGQGIGTVMYDRQPPNLNAGDFCNQGGSSTCSGGGGAGSPGGSGYGSGGSQGVGGVLIVICRGAVSFASGAQMTANGSAGGAGGSNGGGGGSGGGSVSLLYLSGATTGLTMTASGGSGGSGGLAGGAGGAGSTQAKTFSQMGY